MAADRQEQVPWDDEWVLVTRQPVVDALTRVKGYRIVYGMLEDGSPSMPTGPDALRLFNEVFA